MHSYDDDGLRRLLEDIRGTDSWAQLSRRTGLADKTLRKWWASGFDGIQADKLQVLEQAAVQMGLPLTLYRRHSRLWDARLSYEQNISVEPLLDDTAPVGGKNVQTFFLGQTLASPFGISSGLATATPGRVLFVSRVGGADFIVMKTVRSRKMRPHNPPHLYQAEASQVVSAERPAETHVGDVTLNGTVPEVLVNHLGAPSPAPPEWKADFRTANTRLPMNQALCLSVIGTASRTDAPIDELVDDFGTVVGQAAEAGAKLIELNLSCPNTVGREREVFRDPAVYEPICRIARETAPNAILIAKTGYMTGTDLERFVALTAAYVNAYAGINTVPVLPFVSGQTGWQPAFGDGVRAGASGDAIRPFGLQFVDELARIRVKEGLGHVGIIGMGGVTSPSHVIEYLHAGADVVLACTAFLFDPVFGVRVRRYLEAHSHLIPAPKPEALAQIGRCHWSMAVDRFPAEMRRNERATREMHIVLCAFEDQIATSVTGPNRYLEVPPIEEFVRRIESRLRRVGIYYDAAR